MLKVEFTGQFKKDYKLAIKTKIRSVAPNLFYAESLPLTVYHLPAV